MIESARARPHCPCSAWAAHTGGETERRERHGARVSLSAHDRASLCDVRPLSRCWRTSRSGIPGEETGHQVLTFVVHVCVHLSYTCALAMHGQNGTGNRRNVLGMPIPLLAVTLAILMRRVAEAMVRVVKLEKEETWIGSLPYRRRRGRKSEVDLFFL